MRSATVVGAGAVWAALGFKAWYAHATLGALSFLLVPTVRAVELVIGASFPREAGAGYANFDLGFTIAPACAGGNFLVVVFLALVFVHALELGAASKQLGATLAAVPLAWLATIVANAVRIVVALWLHVRGVAFGPLDPPRVHELAGIVVYLAMLVALVVGPLALRRRLAPEAA